MLIHHDSRDYDHAAQEASAEARAKFQALIDNGKAAAANTIRTVLETVPQDRVTLAEALEWHVDEKGNVLVAQGKGAPVQPLHRHAFGQAAERAGVPYRYLQELTGGGNQWQRDLAQKILAEHYGHAAPKVKYLLRSVDGEVRGFLSDSFRRLDSRPLLDAFAQECQSLGLVPVDGTATAVRNAVKVVIPTIFEPIPNEPMVVGLQWSNSDYGAGKHAVALFVLRLWCTNKATMEDSLGTIHLGRKIAENIQLSQRTYDLDTAAGVSAIRDVVKHIAGPEAVNSLMGKIKAAGEKAVTGEPWARGRLANVLTKGEAEQVAMLYKSEESVLLPPGETTWRLSNAVSWLAGQTKDSDRKLELERAAGQIVEDMLGGKKAA